MILVKEFCLILVVLACLMMSVPFIEGDRGKACTPSVQQAGPDDGSPMENARNMRPVKVELRPISAVSKTWELELTIHNLDGPSVFVMIDPIRADASHGPYIALSESSPLTMEVVSQIYLPPVAYFLYSNATAVRLMHLSAGEKYIQNFRLEFPVHETIPPYGETPERGTLDLDKIKYIRAIIGVLPDEEGVRDIIRRKPSPGPYMNGLERITQGIFAGKRLFEVQTTVSSDSIRVCPRVR